MKSIVRLINILVGTIALYIIIVLTYVITDITFNNLGKEMLYNLIILLFWYWFILAMAKLHAKVTRLIFNEQIQPQVHMGTGFEN